jgi:hypothetical protein
VNLVASGVRYRLARYATVLCPSEPHAMHPGMAAVSSSADIRECICIVAISLALMQGIRTRLEGCQLVEDGDRVFIHITATALTSAMMEPLAR